MSVLAIKVSALPLKTATKNSCRWRLEGTGAALRVFQSLRAQDVLPETFRYASNQRHTRESDVADSTWLVFETAGQPMVSAKQPTLGANPH